jgi:hypothetical protein
MFGFGSRSPTEHPHAHAALDQAAADEIWTSLGSLLRSYTAAAELGTPEPHAQVETTADAITLRREQLRLVLDRRAGRWKFSNRQGIFAHGTFALDLDSRITWSGQLRPLELDHAAEWITERFSEHFSDAEREGDPDTEAEAAGEAGGE